MCNCSYKMFGCVYMYISYKENKDNYIWNVVNEIVYHVSNVGKSPSCTNIKQQFLKTFT